MANAATTILLKYTKVHDKKYTRSACKNPIPHELWGTGCMHEQSMAGCVSTALNQPGNEATLRVIGHVHCMYLHSVFSMQLVCPRSPQARCSTTTTSTIPRRVAENVLRKIFGWFILICVVSCIYICADVHSIHVLTEVHLVQAQQELWYLVHECVYVCVYLSVGGGKLTC